MIVLDTNILIDLHLYAFDPAEEYGASILSRAELEFGIRAAKIPRDAAERTRRLTPFDHDVEIVAPTQRTARS